MLKNMSETVGHPFVLKLHRGSFTFLTWMMQATKIEWLFKESVRNADGDFLFGATLVGPETPITDTVSRNEVKK